jgi:hypothetical protein
MTSVYTILLFLLLIGIAIYHAKQSFDAGYAQGQVETLEKVERQDIYSIDSRINPVVVSSALKISTDEAKILSVEGKNTDKQLLVEEYCDRLANNLMSNLIKNNLVLIEVYPEDDNVVLKCVVVLAENKNNFYEKISKSTGAEIIHSS